MLQSMYFSTVMATGKSNIFSDDEFVVVRRDQFDEARFWSSQIRHYAKNLRKIFSSRF